MELAVIPTARNGAMDSYKSRFESAQYGGGVLLVALALEVAAVLQQARAEHAADGTAEPLRHLARATPYRGAERARTPATQWAAV